MTEDSGMKPGVLAEADQTGDPMHDLIDDTLDWLRTRHGVSEPRVVGTTAAGGEGIQLTLYGQPITLVIQPAQTGPGDPLAALNERLLAWLARQPASTGITDVTSVDSEPGKHEISGFGLNGRPVSLMLNWTE